MKAPKIVTLVTEFASKPATKTAFGISGFLTGGVMAINATTKTVPLIERNRDENGYISKKDIVRLCWKYYVPTAVIWGASVAFTIAGHKSSERKIAALMTAYQLADSNLKDYVSKATEMIGSKKAQNIRTEILKDKLNSNPVPNNQIIVTKKGETNCYDVMTGRKFTSDAETIRSALTTLSNRMLSDGYVSLNDLYYELGVDEVYPIGDDFGWSVEDGVLAADFTAQLDSNNEPCLVLDYSVRPKTKYRR